MRGGLAAFVAVVGCEAAPGTTTVVDDAGSAAEVATALDVSRGADVVTEDLARADAGPPSSEGDAGHDAGHDAAQDAGHDAGVTPPADAGSPSFDAGTPTTLDLHDCVITNNPPDLADWPVTTHITEVDFQYGGRDGLRVEFSRREGEGSWPDVTPPGWDGPLQYTVGLAENIGGRWHCSAAIQYWRGLESSGGNLAADVPTMGPCVSFGPGSSCQIARNWYYDGRWGALEGYQPRTGEVIGVFVVAGNVRGVTDGSQSPARERSDVVLMRMPDFSGATYRF